MATMAPIQPRPGDALLIVDVQVDFCPGGALAVPGGDEILPALAAAIASATAAGIPVLASRDWHPRRHPSFEPEGGEWPPHCVQDSPGARFHPELPLPDDTIVVSKGTRFDQDQYSAFDETGLGNFLRREGVGRLWIGGLAQDVCVRHTVLAAREEGFAVQLIEGGTRPIDEADGRAALDEMLEAGARLAGSASA